MGLYTTHRDIYESKSGVTSEVHWIGDADHITIQVGSASTVSVQMSNDEGRSSALSEDLWQDIQTITSPDIYTFDPGARWFRTLQTGDPTVILTQLVHVR